MPNNQQQQNIQQNPQNQTPKQPEKPIQMPTPAPVAAKPPVQNQQKTAPVKTKETSQPRRVSATTKVIGGIIAFVLIAWVLSSLREKQPDSSLVVEGGEEEAELADVASSFQPSMTPIVDSDKTYTMDGVSFVFEPQAADENGMTSTRVRLQIDNLKRNGFPIEVALYRLGTYRGTCANLIGEATTELASMSSKMFLAGAECASSGATRQIAVFQEGNLLNTYIRGINEDMEAEPLVQISSIDVTKIVQPAK